MKLSILLIIISLFLICCNNKDSQFMEERLKDVTKQYQDNLKSFGFSKQLIDHFPNEIKSLPLKLFPNLDSTKGFVNIVLFEFNVDKNMIDSLELNLREKQLVFYTPSDSNLIVVGNAIFKDEPKYKEEKIPIPYFERQDYSHKENILSSNDVYSDRTKSGLTENFQIYILEHQSGIFWKGLNPEKPNVLRLKDGYSKGIALNAEKQVILYWTLIW